MISLGALNIACLSAFAVLFSLLGAGQLVHAILLIYRRDPVPRINLVYEFALVVYLVLTALMIRAALNSVQIQFFDISFIRVFFPDALWVNALIAIIALAVALKNKEPIFLLEAVLVALFLPFVEPLLGEAQIVFLFVSAAYFTFRVMIAHMAGSGRRSEALTQRTPMRAVGLINEGVMLFDLSGKVLFVNDSMRKLLASMGMSGDVVDARFAQSEIKRRADEIQGENDFLIRMEKGESWLISFDEGVFRHKPCGRIMAIDVSEEDEIGKTLAEQNVLLELAHERLQETMDELSEASYDEAVLSAHSKVHDLLGQRFSVIHRRLDGNYDLEESWEITQNLVNTTHDDLTGASLLRPQEMLKAIMSTFAVAGVELTVEGALPEDDNISKVFVGIIREATTNAILHGDALHVAVYIAHEGKSYTLQIENDGTSSKEPVKERGGISGMRREVQSIGGTLQYETAPKFVIKAHVPGEEA